jgi:hypothetical protein
MKVTLSLSSLIIINIKANKILKSNIRHISNRAVHSGDGSRGNCPHEKI